MYSFVITFRELASIIAGFDRIWTPSPSKTEVEVEVEVGVEVRVEVGVEVGVEVEVYVD